VVGRQPFPHGIMQGLPVTRQPGQSIDMSKNGADSVVARLKAPNHQMRYLMPFVIGSTSSFRASGEVLLV
jgi:hypothetical protein